MARKLRKPRRQLRTPLAIDMENHRLFQEAAMRQRRCAVAGCRRNTWHPHHVVYEQHLRVNRLPIYDARNALRLCVGHHAAHHQRQRPVKTRELRDENVAYAFDVLGPAALDYLRRYYDDSEPDERILRHERELVA